MERQRVFWVDACKCICMLCIVNTHLSCTPQPLRALYEPFHLTLFFFLSGYCYTHRPGFLRLIGRKAKTLLLPWLVFSLANLALSSLTHGGIAGFLPDYAANVQTQVLTGAANWFIPSLFTTFVPLYFFAAIVELTDRHVKLRWAAPLVGLLLVWRMLDLQTNSRFQYQAMPWRLNQCLEYTFYVALGYLYRRFGERLTQRLRSLRHPAWLILLAAAYVLAVKYCYSLRISRLLGISYIWNLYFILGSIFVGFALIIAVSHCVPENRFVSCIGRNTLLIFLLHGKVYGLMESVLMRFAAGPVAAICANPISAALLSLILTAAVVLPLLPVCEWINRRLPWLLGKF